MRAGIALVLCASLVSSVAVAEPRKVLVLPLDGNAPAAQRGTLNSSVEKLARGGIEGDVTVGDTTFNETATAVGCNPETPACADTVLDTLSVDELVYGSATTSNGSTTIVLKRATKGEPPKTQTATISASDGGDAAEAGLQPMFGGAAATTAETTPAGGETNAPVPVERRSFFDTTERKLGVAFAGGGAIALAIGLSFWSTKRGLQDDIDSHPTETLVDIRGLVALEDRAASKAMWGNIMVAVGLGLGSVGAYYLWKDHKARSATTVTPVPAETGTGATLVLGGSW